MCIAAASAGRDDIVNIALQYFFTSTGAAAAAAAPVVCAEMFAAALSVRPGAQVEVAELLLQDGIHDGRVTAGGKLPLKGVEIAVAQDARGGGRVVKRTLGDGVPALHLVVAAAAADPQPAKAARRLLVLLQRMLDTDGPYAPYIARPNAPAGSNGWMALHICAWNGDHGVKAAKILLQNGAVATTSVLTSAEGWSMRRLLLQSGAELPLKKTKGQKIWVDDAKRPDWMEPYYQRFDDSY